MYTGQAVTISLSAINDVYNVIATMYMHSFSFGFVVKLKINHQIDRGALSLHLKFHDYNYSGWVEITILHVTLFDIMWAKILLLNDVIYVRDA